MSAARQSRPSSSTSFVSALRKNHLRCYARFHWPLILLALGVGLGDLRLALAQSGQLPPTSLQRLASSALEGEAAAPLLPTSSWTAASSCPAAVSRYAFAQNGEDFYVISGRANGPIVDTVRRYNATTDVWTSLANIPVGSEAPAGAFPMVRFTWRVARALPSTSTTLRRTYGV